MYNYGIWNIYDHGDLQNILLKKLNQMKIIIIIIWNHDMPWKFTIHEPQKKN
jgi:hypothetical protein